MQLKKINQLFQNFNRHDIRYSHWKSNEHLDAAVNGDTDLDILFDKNQEQRVIEILKSNKFYLFEAVWYRKYKNQYS